MTPSEKKAREIAIQVISIAHKKDGTLSGAEPFVCEVIAKSLNEAERSGYEAGKMIASTEEAIKWNQTCIDAERRGFERAKELVASLILNDGYAITFQTMGQYRTAIAKNIRSLTHDEA